MTFLLAIESEEQPVVGRHACVHNGSVEAYLSKIERFLNLWQAWNKANGNRCLLPVLFNSGDSTGAWQHFDVRQPEMGVIAEFAKGWQPGTTSPTPPQVGKVRLKKIGNVRTQARVTADTLIGAGVTPEGREFEFVRWVKGQNMGGVDDWAEVKAFVWKPLVELVEEKQAVLGSPVGGIAMQVTRGGAFNAAREYANGQHEGLDLRAVDGGGRPVKVRACGAGVVERVRAKDPGTGYGKYVRVRQDDGLVVWYCHMRETWVTEGERLEAGEVLGVAGSSGNSTGVHLHLTVQRPGSGLSGYVVDDVVDPGPLLGLQA